VPDGPTMMKTSPFLISKDKSSRTLRPPSRFVTWSNLIISR